MIDPASGRDEIADVAITKNRIAWISPSIPLVQAHHVIDAKGLLVTPGLVDLHTHLFFGPDTKHYLSDSPKAVLPDAFAPESCTTTVVDAGSAGHRTFAKFKAQIVEPSKTRVLAFLNIVGGGMRGGAAEQDLGDMDAKATAEALKAYPELLVGVKVAHYTGPGWEPIDRAVLAAQAGGGHVMVDFGSHKPPLSLSELLLHRLRPGDMFTHCFGDAPGRMTLVDERGVLRPFVRKARERGVLFDVGYGGASFVFSQANPAISQGFAPDTASTDMHRVSRRGSMRDLVLVLSKLGALGIKLPDLIQMSTLAPANALGRADLGRLVEGGPADIAVFAVESGRFSFADVKGANIEGTQRLSCEMTLQGGKVVWDRGHRVEAKETEQEKALPPTEASSACPSDMVEVQGAYCPKVEQVCLLKRNRRQCAEFQRPSVCQRQTEAKHFCMDRYEWPNQKGSMATIMVSWKEAKAACEGIGKRLCTEAEWTLACEGPELWPFPYGYVRDAKKCSIDKPSPHVNEAKLFSPKTQAAELARLDQREPSGSREGCISPFGVADLTGNVDEWVVNERGVPYASALKGGNWGEYRNACRPATLGHSEGFRYYQIGFRCCSGVDSD